MLWIHSYKAMKKGETTMSNIHNKVFSYGLLAILDDNKRIERIVGRLHKMTTERWNTLYPDMHMDEELEEGRYPSIARTVKYSITGGSGNTTEDHPVATLMKYSIEWLADTIDTTGLPEIVALVEQHFIPKSDCVFGRCVPGAWVEYGSVWSENIEIERDYVGGHKYQLYATPVLWDKDYKHLPALTIVYPLSLPEVSSDRKVFYEETRARQQNLEELWHLKHEAILQAAREQGKFLCICCAGTEMEADNMTCSACESFYAVDWFTTDKGRFFRNEIGTDAISLRKIIKGMVTLYKGWPTMPPEYKLHWIANAICRLIVDTAWHEEFDEEVSPDGDDKIAAKLDSEAAFREKYLSE